MSDRAAKKTVIIDKKKLIGFQRTKPDCIGNGATVVIRPDSKNILTERYKEWVYREGRYYLFMTLTFGLNVSMQGRIGYINDFIKYHNKMCCSREYYKGDAFMEGFAFFEEHPSRVFEGLFHVHILVKSNYKYSVKGFAAHKDIFRKAAAKVLNTKDKKVFYNSCINIQEAGDEGRIVYCFDQMNDGNLDNIKTIGRDGLSDVLGLVGRSY